MQMFVSNDFKIEGNNIFIYEKRIFDQLRKVLRVKPGYEFYLQELKKVGEKEVNRYLVEFLNFDNGIVNGLIKLKVSLNIKYQNIGVAIAFLNKQDKMELIVQKLTELGVENIIFYPSKRSVIKTLSENKVKRLNKIILEAVEQSWNLFVPNLILLDKFEELFNLNFKLFLVADVEKMNVEKCNLGKKDALFIIGPEGGFDDNEYSFFLKKFEELEKKGKDGYFVNFSDNVLRAETAAIVAGWLLKDIEEINIED